MKYTSDVIFRTTLRRASFHKVSIVTPDSWTPGNCPHLKNRLRSAQEQTYSVADIRVTRARHPHHGARPWAAQSGGCGVPGEYVSLGHEMLFQNQTILNGNYCKQRIVFLD